MTYFEANVFKPEKDDLFTDLQAASDNKWLENDFFNKSIAAYQLALHSSIKYSIADLYRSGSWQKYEQQAAALARKHPSRDPYAAYLSRAEHDDWRGRTVVKAIAQHLCG